MSDISDILKVIDGAPERFGGKMPEIEKKIFGQITVLIKELHTDSSGRIAPTIENLQLISDIKLKLRNIVVSKEYATAVKEFVGNINTISGIKTSGSELGADGNNLISAAAQQQIDNTVEALTGAGYRQAVVNKLHNLLLINVTQGGDYADLLDTLRTQIVSTKDNKGMLSEYTAQYVNNSLQQFDGYVSKMVADIKGYEWFRYGGTNITTTREFCRHLTAKDYFHISELPDIISGNIDGHQCKIYEKTGLPYGMVEGTNESNFFVYRGGYYGDQIGCRHRINGVPTESVPKEIRYKLFPLASKETRQNALEIIKDKGESKEIEAENMQSGYYYDDKRGIRNLIKHSLREDEVKAALALPQNIDKLKFVDKSKLGEGKDMNNPKDLANVLKKQQSGITHYNIYEYQYNGITYYIKFAQYNSGREMLYSFTKKP